MYAVVRTGGKQYRVEPGIEFLVEKLTCDEGKPVELSDVLLVSDGTDVTVGTPQVNATVVCKCVAHEKGPKLRTIKYRRHKNYKRHYGHRQIYTRLFVENIERKGN